MHWQLIILYSVQDCRAISFYHFNRFDFSITYILKVFGETRAYCRPILHHLNAVKLIFWEKNFSESNLFFQTKTNAAFYCICSFNSNYFCKIALKRKALCKKLPTLIFCQFCFNNLTKIFCITFYAFCFLIK